jgi:hypothetical protein
MSEITDIIVPILQRIQADLAEVKRDLLDTQRGLGAKIDNFTTRMDDFEGYFTYTMGLTQQNKADIQRLRADVAAIKARLNGHGPGRAEVTKSI